MLRPATDPEASAAREAHRTEGLAVPPLGDALRTEADRITADIAPDLPPSVATALVAAWAQLFGLISFEVFGQFERVVEDRDVFFAHAVGRLAVEVGLRPSHAGAASRAPRAGRAAGAPADSSAGS
ncbi:TetR-like C-terminal domain-containing protein [Streptomyces sp. NPDC018833]|uniref:TetR-like C-terminal domain-containing protein n=1 Tax=Streptomyces sp. NPDC018833 TaxID=3365053 RepID=UPI0037BDCFF3